MESMLIFKSAQELSRLVVEDCEGESTLEEEENRARIEASERQEKSISLC